MTSHVESISSTLRSGEANNDERGVAAFRLELGQPWVGLGTYCMRGAGWSCWDVLLVLARHSSYEYITTMTRYFPIILNIGWVRPMHTRIVYHIKAIRPQQGTTGLYLLEISHNTDVSFSSLSQILLGPHSIEISFSLTLTNDQ